MANERHNDARGWEVDSSTRQSVHPYTKYSPFRTATSTTAANLLAIDRGEIAVNWVFNPSMELAMTTGDASGYVVTGAAIARSGSQQSAGSYAMSVDPANSAVGEGFYWTTPAVAFSVHPQHLTAQIEHRGHSASGSVKLEIRSADGTTVLATSGTSSLATSWVRVTASYTITGSTDAVDYRVYMTTVENHNISFYVDKLMFEVREDTNAVSTYVDGNLGLNHEWSGTANASTSRKRPAMSVIRGIQIKNESGTSAEIVYVAFDAIASSSTGIPVLAGATYESNFPVDFRDNVSIISASGTPTVSGVIWGVNG